MKAMKFFTALAVLSLTACATSGPLAGGMSPREAILAAADAAPGGVRGVFMLPVAATGREQGRVYLNSELDYRDQRNLTIAIVPAAARALQERHGLSPEAYFKGRAILVNGSARRVRIDFTSNGRPTGKYYYQTHVDVTDPDQIRVVAS